MGGAKPLAALSESEFRQAVEEMLLDPDALVTRPSEGWLAVERLPHQRLRLRVGSRTWHAGGVVRSGMGYVCAAGRGS